MLANLTDKSRITVLKSEDFSGEYDKRSFCYILFLWLVSYFAMLTNYTKAFYLKLSKKRNISFEKILWEMGRDKEHISSFVVDRFSRYNHQAKWGATMWPSLDLFYNYHQNILPNLDGDLEGFLTRLWIGKMENRQAVTNRKTIVVNLIKEAFVRFKDEPEVRLVSIASGSAQAVVEAMKDYSVDNVEAVLIDLDKTALEEARRLTAGNGLKNKFEFVRGTYKAVEKVCKGSPPHIIEMVGLLDYFPRGKAIALIRMIYECLRPGGVFITSNIKKNREKVFLDHLLIWPMIYRSEKDLCEVLIRGGFTPEDIHLIYEPFMIHGIAYCIKFPELKKDTRDPFKEHRPCSWVIKT